MGLFQDLSALALQQLVQSVANTVGLNATGDALVTSLRVRFTDHSQKLTQALQTANDRAWKAIELALAGETFWDRCKGALAKAEDRAFAQQVRTFLDGSPLTKVSSDHPKLCQQCLTELGRARKHGLLTSGALPPDELATKAGAFARFADPQSLLDAEWKVVVQMADDLQRQDCPGLARILKARPPKSPSMLAVGVRYFFRREVETDAQLFQGLAIAKLEGISERQEKGFAALNQVLTDQGQRLEGMMSELVDWMAKIDSRLQGIEQTMQKLLEQYQLQNREVRPSDSMSLRNDAERQLAKKVIEEYRALPEGCRRQSPHLLTNAGKLEVAAGNFEAAQRDFQDAANLTADPKVKAEAHHNAYQAALERQGWDEALAALRQAVALDPGRFAPFPFARYEPKRILGAGGFGVVFLCEHRHLGRPVVIKSLMTSELDRAVTDVFSEARVLEDLNHPAIIRLRDCDYADAGKSRPFLVMDFFDGASLEAHVDAQGPLSPAELLAVAVPTAQALKAAHDRAILHRDVKPANLLVRRDGDRLQVKLIDFGLALRPTTLGGKVSTDGPQAHTTLGKSIAGTLHYAAPEQMGQGGEVGPHSDVYGFGRTCYFALLGTSEPDDVEKESLPESWRRFLSRCTGRKLAHRLADFTAVLAELDALKTQPADPVVEPPPSKIEGVPAGGRSDEKSWLEKHPVALECARWYKELLARFYGDVPMRFGLTMITLYVGGRARMAVYPRKDGALVHMACPEGVVAETVDFLNREKAAFTTTKSDEKSIWFKVDLQQLKNHQGAHEWIAQRLAPEHLMTGRS